VPKAHEAILRPLRSPPYFRLRHRTSAQSRSRGSFAVVDPALFASTSGDNELKRGVTGPQENPNNGASLVTWLDAEINGKRVFVRGVSPLKVPDGKAPYVLSLESTYDFLLKQL
jgi:hypothetical protein